MKPVNAGDGVDGLSAEAFNRMMAATCKVEGMEGMTAPPDTVQTPTADGRLQVRHSKWNATYPAFAAVAISSPAGTIDVSNPEMVFAIGDASNSTTFWGILQNGLSCMEVGWVLVSGFTPALVRFSNPEHKYATFDATRPGGLKSAATGTAKIIGKGVADANGDCWCMLQLGVAEPTAAYSGYFALRLAESTDEAGIKSYKVRIVDGATYNAQKGSSGTSTAKVNDVVFNIPFYESGAITQTSIFALRYSAPIPASGDIPAQVAKVEVVNLRELGFSSLPPDEKKNSYFQLGRAILTSGVWNIAQDHTAGVVQMWWFMACNEVL